MSCEIAKRKVHLNSVAIMRYCTNDNHGTGTQGNRAYRFNISSSAQYHIRINRVTDAAVVSAIVSSLRR
jgi:hypothetical protein